MRSNNKEWTQAWSYVRVDFKTKSPGVELLLWGLDNQGAAPIAEELRVVYSDAGSLPEWVQRKLSVLMGFDHESPTEAVPNIGRRVSKHVYWVFRSPGENILQKSSPKKHGPNPRAKGKSPRQKDS